MELELKLRCFRSFKDAEMRDVPNLRILLGANDVGKITTFSVVDFLKSPIASNVGSALSELGESPEFRKARSRGVEGSVEIESRFRATARSALATCFLQIDERHGRACVARFVFADFQNGIF